MKLNFTVLSITPYGDGSRMILKRSDEPEIAAYGGSTIDLYVRNREDDPMFQPGAVLEVEIRRPQPVTVANPVLDPGLIDMPIPEKPAPTKPLGPKPGDSPATQHTRRTR